MANPYLNSEITARVERAAKAEAWSAQQGCMIGGQYQNSLGEPNLHGQAGQNRPHEPEIARLMSRIHKEATGLGAELENLYMRTASVTRAAIPETSKGGANEAMEPVQTDLGNALHILLNDLTTMRRALADAVNRIEL